MVARPIASFSCAAALLGGALLLGCGPDEAGETPLATVPVASPDGGTTLTTGGDAGATFDVAGQESASWECRVAVADGSSCECVELGAKPTSLYLVLDRSSSMGETIDGSTRTRWNLTRTALLDPTVGVLRKLGGRIAIGASVFPRGDGEDACNPGFEAFSLARGTPAVYDALAARLAVLAPKGVTPTAASLRDVTPKILALPQPAAVILATDGAPNCGTASCSADRCGYTIERAMLGAITCDGSTNCCDPGVTDKGIGWRACLDTDSAASAVRALADAGVRVFVLGIGTERYAAELDTLAVAADTAKTGDGPKYYAPRKLTVDGLAEALSTIAGKAFESCTVDLEKAPADPTRTNVLVDGVVVPQDSSDGWQWSSDDRITLMGATCDRVLRGEVGRVQVVSGCRTVTK